MRLASLSFDVKQCVRITVGGGKNVFAQQLGYHPRTPIQPGSVYDVHGMGQQLKYHGMHDGAGCTA